MAYRFTNTDKWKDNWFLELNPTEKLLFYYLVDNCDIAGFYEVSYKTIEFFVGINKNEVLGAIKGLKRGLILSTNNEFIYIKNFLRHQKNIPLNKYNNAHKSILNFFKDKVDNFNDIQFFIDIPCYHIKKNQGNIIEEIVENLGAYLGLNSPTGKGNGKDSSNSNNKGNSIGRKKKEIIDMNIYERFMNIYYEWFKKISGVSPKITNVDGKALNELIVHFKKLAKDKNGEENVEENAIYGWEYLFTQYDLWENFYKKQTKLVQINTNINNIITSIKNGTKKSGSTGVSDDFKQRVAKKIFSS